MMSKEEILARASAYDFNAVKDYLEQGGNKEIYDGEGRSLLACLLFGYYQRVYYSDPDDIKLLEKLETSNDFTYDLFQYCKVPLEERPHTIRKEIEYLMAKGVGLNAVGWEEAKECQQYDVGVETPLYYAVCHRDYCMTKYLLEHGADPCISISPDSDDPNERDYWLLVDLDIAILNGDRGDAMNNDIEIAALLMHYGLDKWEGGYCISVDPEKRSIHGHAPYMRY